MTDRLSHLKLAMDLGFNLGQGKKVDLSEMADKHLTKECPRCEGSGKLQVWDHETDGTGRIEMCPDCKGTGRVPA